MIRGSDTVTDGWTDVFLMRMQGMFGCTETGRHTDRWGNYDLERVYFASARVGLWTPWRPNVMKVFAQNRVEFGEYFALKVKLLAAKRNKTSELCDRPVLGVWRKHLCLTIFWPAVVSSLTFTAPHTAFLSSPCPSFFLPSASHLACSCKNPSPASVMIWEEILDGHNPRPFFQAPSPLFNNGCSNSKTSTVMNPQRSLWAFCIRSNSL